MSNPATEDEITYHDKIRNNYIKKINHDIEESVRNKAMLSLKYDDLNFKINVVQISIICISASLTLIASLTSYYNFESQAIDTITIIFTASITLIMAIYRFFKLDDKKEKICNLLESYTLIINKFKKFLVKVSDFIIKVINVNEWEEIILNYKTELLDYYVSIKENFDNIFSYKEVIKYRNIYIKLSLEQNFLNNELDTIHYCHKDTDYLEYYNKKNSCCYSTKSIDKKKFMLAKVDSLNKRREEYESYQKITNQEHYNNFCLKTDIEQHSPKNLNSSSEENFNSDKFFSNSSNQDSIKKDKNIMETNIDSVSNELNEKDVNIEELPINNISNNLNERLKINIEKCL